MSIFRPHKTKPRQFNYIPRHYDPVKEQREQRRRELHGTSSADDDAAYTPGRYIRTQREAREASREESGAGGVRGLRTLVFAMALVVVALVVLMPRIMGFVELANEQKSPVGEVASVEAADVDSLAKPTITLHEQHADIDFREFESLSPEIINEIEEWQSSVGEITIYDDDVEIKDGRRVER